MSFAVKSGLEQRDAAIKVGELSTRTLLFSVNKFLIPSTKYDALRNESDSAKLLLESL